MDRAAGSPQALRDVRRAIERGQQEIHTAVNAMRGSVRKADWNDARSKSFEQDLEEVLRSLGQFDAKANDLKNYLSRKADELDRYLSR